MFVRKPIRVPHRGMHCHGNRQGPTGCKIVYNGCDSIDSDFAIKATAALSIHRIGDEILGPEALFDVGEVVIGGLDQVGTFYIYGLRVVF